MFAIVYTGLPENSLPHQVVGPFANPALAGLYGEMLDDKTTEWHIVPMTEPRADVLPD